METQKCEFHKIKDKKFVRDTALSEVIYCGSGTVHFRCSLSTMQATPLPAPAE